MKTLTVWHTSTKQAVTLLGFYNSDDDGETMAVVKFAGSGTRLNMVSLDAIEFLGEEEAL